MMSDFHYGAHPKLIKRARELRQCMTPAERALWRILRRKQLAGYYFRRQHPIKYYIVDFYCHSERLVVEVDGSIHLKPENKQYDARRTAVINRFGIDVLRFTNEQVLQSPQWVLSAILGFIRQKGE